MFDTMFKKIIVVLVIASFSIWCGNSFAESVLMKPSDREGLYEITLLPNYVDSKDISGDQDSSVHIQDSWGWGFGFGYNFTEHWELEFDIGWRSANYDANIYVEDNDDPTNSGLKHFKGVLDTTSSLFTLTYNILPRRFTPYVSGIMGWTFVDSNVPTGPPQNWCWWDPWYGYICSSTVPTHSETSFSYGGALGLRFDAGERVFIRLGYNKLWTDFDNAGTEDFDTFRLDIGFAMN